MAAMAEPNPFTEAKRREHVEAAFAVDEVRLANRNSGVLLEALRHDLTPVGLHYLLNHFDVPYVADDGWQVALRARQGRRRGRSAISRRCPRARCA